MVSRKTYSGDEKRGILLMFALVQKQSRLETQSEVQRSGEERKQLERFYHLTQKSLRQQESLWDLLLAQLFMLWKLKTRHMRPSDGEMWTILRRTKREYAREWSWKKPFMAELLQVSALEVALARVTFLWEEKGILWPEKNWDQSIVLLSQRGVRLLSDSQESEGLNLRSPPNYLSSRLLTWGELDAHMSLLNSCCWDDNTSYLIGELRWCNAAL